MKKACPMNALYELDKSHMDINNYSIYISYTGVSHNLKLLTMESHLGCYLDYYHCLWDCDNPIFQQSLFCRLRLQSSHGRSCFLPSQYSNFLAGMYLLPH